MNVYSKLIYHIDYSCHIRAVQSSEKMTLYKGKRKRMIKKTRIGIKGKKDNRHKNAVEPPAILILKTTEFYF